MKEVEMPEVLIRQAWNAQDPLASVHYYSVLMRIVVPAAFGVRMCLHCPDCNLEDTDQKKETCIPALTTWDKITRAWAVMLDLPLALQ